jgi:hypothetical protein
MSTNKPTLTLTSAHLLTAQQPSTSNYLVKGYLEANSTILLYAEPAAGKSLIAIDWASSLASGKDWNGSKVQQSNVVILAGEGHNGITKRLKAWELKHQTTPPADSLFVSGGGVDLDTEAGLSATTEALDALAKPIGLIVVDTLHRHFNGDENSSSNMGALIRNLDQLRQQFNCSVLLVHHSGHGSTERPRGSSSLKAAVDTSYRLNVSNQVRTLTCDKSKDSEPVEPTVYALELVSLTGWIDEENKPLSSVVLSPTNQVATSSNKPFNKGAQKAMEALKNSGGSCTVDDWRKKFDELYGGTDEANRKAFDRAKDNLLEQNLISIVDSTVTLIELIKEDDQ